MNPLLRLRISAGYPGKPDVLREVGKVLPYDFVRRYDCAHGPVRFVRTDE